MDVILSQIANAPVIGGTDGAFTTHGLLDTLARELNPVGPIEDVLVREVSRRAAQMEQFDFALGAFRNHTANALIAVQGATSAQSPQEFASVVATLMSSDKHEALFRQGIAASRGLVAALHELRELRQHNDESMADWLRPDSRFTTEQRCLAYLARRFKTGSVTCSRCHAARRGSYIAVRGAWQCSECQSQTGLRAGTCMERSALPLVTWFNAIRIILMRPVISTGELSLALGIRRRQTAQSVESRIRAAVASEQATARLAELDEIYFAPT